MYRMQTPRPYAIAAILLMTGFAMGSICASWPLASAQQRFGKDDVKSVPKSFMEGGDRGYTTLKEIATTSKASSDSLEKIERSIDDSDKRHRELMKKVDSLDARLKQLNVIVADAL